MLVLEKLVFGVKLPEVKGQILQHNIQIAVVVDIRRRKNIVDFYYLWMLHPSQNTELPQSSESEDATGEYFTIFFKSVNLPSFSVLDPVDLPISSPSNYFFIDVSVCEDDRLRDFEWLHDVKNIIIRLKEFCSL